MSAEVSYRCPTVGEIAAAAPLTPSSTGLPMQTSASQQDSTDEYRYYVDQCDYTCPMGVESDVRFVIDVRRDRILVAHIRPHGCNEWRDIDCEEDRYMETNLLGDLLYDLADYASKDDDVIPGEVDPANFSEWLPEWA